MKLSTLASLLVLSAGFSGQIMAETTTSSTNLSSNTVPLTLVDIMHFDSLGTPVLADNGQALAVEAEPDRGDSHTLVRNLTLQKSFDIAQTSKPVVSADGRFVAMTKGLSLLEQETLDAKAKKQFKNAMVLLDTQTGEQQVFERVKSATFVPSGSHLVIQFEPVEPAKADATKADTSKGDTKSGAQPVVEQPSSLAAHSVANTPASTDDKALKIDKFDQGSAVKVIDLASQKVLDFDHVTGFNVDKASLNIAVAVNDINTAQHQVLLVNLASNSHKVVHSSKTAQMGALALSENGQWLAFTQGDAAEKPYGRHYQLNMMALASGKMYPVPVDKKWQINRYAELMFSADSERLFFGRVPEVSQQLSLPKITQSSELFDTELIAAKRELRVWHGEDPLIKPNEVKRYDKQLKQTYLAVLHVNSVSQGDYHVVQLADETVPDVSLSEQRRFMLASSDKPYQKMITWAGFYKDYYLVDVNTGRKVQFLTQQASDAEPTLSANGKYAAYYQQGQVYLYDVAQARRYNLTKSLPVSFADEDHDYPSPAPGYGFGPWIEDDAGIIVYDKYDVWQFNSTSHKGFMLTQGEGRNHKVQYRVTGLYDDKLTPMTLGRDESVLLHGYSDITKADGFYQAKVGVAGVTPLMAGEYKLTLLGRSKNADKIVFSKERYDLFPDLYTSSVNAPQSAVRQTELDAQRKPFGWGKAELVHWTNGDGTKLDGVLIKPVNYQEGTRVPVMVYFYRFMSDRLHAFPQMKINHRPNFAWYADNGYAIFLPDIRFEVGYPGATSVQALTSGVQKLIEMGVADPDAVGIQGHSWGGYQTAFAVTQTNIFKAAVTGAPVSNMTSAYSGIRHGTGLARQFQYETGQSRMGESLFAAPQKYIENSPVFYVERIQTPMMIMFGDKDDAVPWEQGVELYLAMRRAGKDVVFLQYQDEPHHLKKYPNKLDYTVRMKQYFDHYLKGAPAPQWLTSGEAYIEYSKDDE